MLYLMFLGQSSWQFGYFWTDFDCEFESSKQLQSSKKE